MKKVLKSFAISFFICTFASRIKILIIMANKKDIRVVSFPISQYDRGYLEKLSDEELSSHACAEGESNIWTLEEFQDDLNNDNVDSDNNWIFFLTK